MNQGHISAAEVVNLETLNDELSPQETHALIKTSDMEVIRMVLPKGKDIMEHSVEGEISVQCLKGKVLFNVDNTAHELGNGDWLYLNRKQLHSLHAQMDSVLLVTILFTKN